MPSVLRRCSAKRVQSVAAPLWCCKTCPRLTSVGSTTIYQREKIEVDQVKRGSKGLRPCRRPQTHRLVSWFRCVFLDGIWSALRRSAPKSASSNRLSSMVSCVCWFCVILLDLACWWYTILDSPTFVNMSEHSHAPSLEIPLWMLHEQWNEFIKYLRIHDDISPANESKQNQETSKMSTKTSLPWVILRM